MKDLILYGNVVFDTIHIYDSEFKLGIPNNKCKIIESKGGIGNHESTINLTELDLDYSIQSVIGTEYDPSSKAFVIVDKKDGIKRKTSCVKWGCDTRLSKEYLKKDYAQWHHISYLDALPCLSAYDIISMLNIGGIVSVDFCGSDFLYDKEILNYVNFIITSDTEINKIPQHLHYKCIVHSPDGTSFWEHNILRYIKNPIKVDEDICILGAGDAYCVSFIYKFLKTLDMERSITFAHENAYSFLVKKYKL